MKIIEIERNLAMLGNLGNAGTQVSRIEVRDGAFVGAAPSTIDAITQDAARDPSVVRVSVLDQRPDNGKPFPLRQWRVVVDYRHATDPEPFCFESIEYYLVDDDPEAAIDEALKLAPLTREGTDLIRCQAWAYPVGTAPERKRVLTPSA